MKPIRFSLLATILVAFAFAGCDNADPITGTGGDDANISSTEDAAVSIANALSLEGGGALDIAASASELVVTSSSSSSFGGDHFPDGCVFERSYNEATFTWTRFIECEHGNPGGLFYALFSRTATYQFLDGDTPVQYPEEADAVNLDIIDGEGIRIAPGFSHKLLDIGADLNVANIHRELVTVNGTYDRAATDTLYTRNAERTLTYDLALNFIDVQGPARDRHNWRNAVSGTLEGVYHAVITFMRGDAYEEVEIWKEFTIVFGEGDGDVRDALITIDGRTFRADIETGQVQGVD